MTVGKPFEVSKEVFERAKARGQRGGGYYYMTTEDQRAHFSDAILMGYGLYNCKIIWLLLRQVYRFGFLQH